MATVATVRLNLDSEFVAYLVMRETLREIAEHCEDKPWSPDAPIGEMARGALDFDERVRADGA